MVSSSTGPCLRGDDLDQQLAPDAAAGVVRRAAARAPARACRSARIVGMVEAEALRPCASTGHSASCAPSEPRLVSKSSGREPGNSTGRPIQKGWSAGAEQRLAAVACRRAACRSRAARPRPAPQPRPPALLKAAIRSRGAPASSAISSNWRAMVDGQRHQARRRRGRRVVAQWMWLSAASSRSARCGAAVGQEVAAAPSRSGYSGEQSRRDTAKAPQALA